MRVRIAPRDDRILCGVSEFGEHLGELVRRTPGARGALLTDGGDETIDSARDPDAISELDLRIAGAQLGQSMVRIQRSAGVFELGRPALLLEGRRQALIAAPLLDEYLLTLLLAPGGNIARAMRAFGDESRRILSLLA